MFKPFGPVQSNLVRRVQNNLKASKIVLDHMTQRVSKAETIYFSLVTPLHDGTLQFRPSLVIVQL